MSKRFCLNYKAWFGTLVLLSLAVLSATYFRRAPVAPEWMIRQIESDLAPFIYQKNLSQKKIAEMAEGPGNDHFLFVHYSIRKNKIFSSHRIPSTHPLAKECLFPRIKAIENSLQQTTRKYPLPDIDFVISMHDALIASFESPIFVMAKVSSLANQILIPDFEALRGRYQVLAGQDITKEGVVPKWEEKLEKLVWRGGPGQHPPEGCCPTLNPEEPHCLSRIKLCDLGEKYPNLIDAKFSYLEESYRSLNRYVGSFVPYESQIRYKYQMQIDGYSCAYSTSGWKLFANSVMFKEDSSHIQWYSNELKPYVHYIPVKEGLVNLVDQIQWAMDHDEEAKEIAARARAFALSHITQELNRLYLYHVLLAYSRLNWVE